MSETDIHIPFFSFIIPVYNTEKQFLIECLESVLAIKSCDYEILLIDNNSQNEETLDILKKYAKNELVRFYVCKEKGVSNARNVGLNEAKGKYVIFVDSDDVVAFQNFDRIVPCVKKHEDTDLFVFTHNHMDEDGNLTILGCNDGKDFVCPSIFELYKMGIRQKATYIRESVWSKIYRKEILKDNYFDPELKYGEDNLFVLEVCSQGIKIRACAVPLYTYRSRQSSATKKYSPNILEDRNKNLFKLDKFYKKHGYEKEYITFAKDVIFRSYMHLILRLWIFHSDNPMSVLEKRKKAIEVLNSDFYKKMLGLVQKEDMTKKEQVIFRLLKHNLVGCAYAVFSLYKPVKHLAKK